MIRYRPLFHVDIAHDYFLSRGDVVFEAQPDADRAALTNIHSVSQYLEVAPDEATLARMAGHRMLFRATGSGFTVAVQLDPSAPDVRPFIPPQADFAMTFSLRITDGRFPNYTELGPVTTEFYRFGNDSQNRTAGVNFLSARVPPFSPARRYAAGEARAQAAGASFDLFVALRDTGPSATPLAADWRRVPADTWSASVAYRTGAIVLFRNQTFRARVDNPGIDLTVAAEWEPLSVLGNQYVTSSDSVLPIPHLFNLDIGDLALARATVRIVVPGGAAASEQTFAADQGALRQVQIDMRGLTSGRYRVEVIDATGAAVRQLQCFLSREAAAGNWFGVIEIGRGSSDFALFNADGTLRTPRYVLRFLNRATRWRYIFPSAQQAGAGAEVAIEAGDNRILVTPTPRPLTRFGVGSRLQADSSATPNVSEEILLPAPDVNSIRRQNAEWFSETHVPNLTVGP